MNERTVKHYEQRSGRRVDQLAKALEELPVGAIIVSIEDDDELLRSGGNANLYDLIITAELEITS